MLPATLAITNNEYVAVKQRTMIGFIQKQQLFVACKYQITSEHCLALQITNVWKRQQLVSPSFIYDGRSMILQGKKKDSKKRHTLSLCHPLLFHNI